MAYNPDTEKIYTNTNKHFYANGTSGNDTYDGTAEVWTSGCIGPKKTLQAVFNLVPSVVNSSVFIHLAGIFADTGNIVLQSTLQNGLIEIDGGPSVTTVAGPWTSADIHSTTSIGKTGLNLTVNAYQGYYLKAEGSPLRTIHENSATTFTPNANWESDPGAVNFSVVRPTTSFSPTSAKGAIFINVSGVGRIRFQRIYMSEKAWFGSNDSSTPGSCSCSVYLNGIIFNPLDNSYGFVCNNNIGYYYIYDTIYNSGVLSTDKLSTSCLSGFFQVHNSGIYILGGYFRAMFFYKCWIDKICSIYAEYMQFYTCSSKNNTWQIVNETSYATTKIIGNTTSIVMFRTNLVIKEGVTISGTNHGIKLEDFSRLHLSGNVTGTSTGYGVIVGENCSLFTKSGTPPTLTGTPYGDWAFFDYPNTKTWAQIPATDTTYLIRANTYWF